MKVNNMSKDNNIITNINEEPHKADMDIFIKQSHPSETPVPDAEREKQIMKAALQHTEFKKYTLICSLLNLRNIWINM